jgi:hypothetical protein
LGPERAFLVKKINQVLQNWPAGAVLTQPWIDAAGLSGRAAAKNAMSGNLIRLGGGAYARPGDKVTWEGGIVGLQYGESPPDLSFWPGGLTALHLAGFSHYVMLGRETLYLFGQPGRRLAKWFSDAEWGVNLQANQSNLLHRDSRIFTPYSPPGRDYQIHISSPEMAVLEWLHVLPNESLFGDTVVDTFGGLTTLRPGRLQSLLEACGSVRVKRVFLLLARNTGYAWYAHLDKSRVDLGKGKRQLVKGGILDKEYLITVPERFTHGF